MVRTVNVSTFQLITEKLDLRDFFLNRTENILHTNNGALNKQFKKKKLSKFTFQEQENKYESLKNKENKSFVFVRV